MSHGFCLVLPIDGKKTVEPDSISIGSKVSSQIHLSGTSIYLKADHNADFVKVSERGDWVIVSVGISFSGLPFSEELAGKISSKNISTADEMADEIRLISGQYAAVCYNRLNKSLLLVSDPSGLRSLFSTRRDGVLFIASSLGMLRTVVGEKRLKADIETQAFLLRYGYKLPSKTLYQDVAEHAPKQVIVTSIGFNKIESRAYFDPTLGKDACGYCDEYTDDKIRKSLLQHLLKACSVQAGAASKVGVLLGGFDSALVASLLCKLGLQVETYSFFYDEEKYNQPFVNELAEFLNIKHHWVKIEPATILNGLQNYADNANWPTMWLNYVIQTQLLCRQMVADEIELCFSGDGCDTLFMGYPSTYRRGNVYKAMPRLNKRFVKLFKRALHGIGLEYALGHIFRVGMSLLDASTHSVTERPWHSFQLLDEYSYKRLTGFDASYGLDSKVHFDNLENNAADASYQRKVYRAKSLISPNRCKLVGSSDLAGMAIYSPYLQESVVKFAEQLPETLLRRADGGGQNEGKHVLMEMADKEGLLPRPIIYQKKMAAIKSPIDDWISGELLRPLVQHMKNFPGAINQRYIDSIFKQHLAEKIYKEHFSQDSVVSLTSSLLLTYSAFFK